MAVHRFAEGCAGAIKYWGAMAKQLYEDAERIEDEDQEWLLHRNASERLDAAFALMEAAVAKPFDRAIQRLESEYANCNFVRDFNSKKAPI
jgi:hypothetical protein